MNNNVDSRHYVSPDMQAVRGALNKFNETAVSGEYEFMPSLQARLVQTASVLSDNTRAIIDQVRTLEVTVDSSDIKAVIEQWAAIKTSSLSREEQAPAISRLAIYYAESTEGLLNKITEVKSNVFHRVDEVEHLALEHYADDLLEYDATRLDELEEQAKRLVAEEEQLREDKKTIVNAITVLQSTSWVDHVKGLLPTAAQLQALVNAVRVKKVDANLVELALQRITQYVDIVGGGIKLASLIEARNKITDKLLALSAQKNKNVVDAQALKERKDKIDRLTQLLEARALWLTNMQLIIQGLTLFLEGARSVTTSTEQSMQQRYAQLTGFLAFLRQITR